MLYRLVDDAELGCIFLVFVCADVDTIHVFHFRL